MSNTNRMVYTARNIQDALFYLKSIPGIAVFAGCTGNANGHGLRKELPAETLLISAVHELKQVELHERYLDIGAAAVLSTVDDLGKNKIPSVLLAALRSTAHPLVRNVATLGGNICLAGVRGTLYAPLLALEAKLELRSAVETQLVPISKFHRIPPMSMLTKIRIPLDDWDIAVFQKVGPEHAPTAENASFTFLAKIQKNILTDIHIAFCGMIVFRSVELENRLIGSKLPVSEKNAASMLETAAQMYDACETEQQIHAHPILKAQFLNLLNHSLSRLS